MESIKDLVSASLEKNKVLARLRAELRAQVFVAIEEHEGSNGGESLSKKTSTPQREALFTTSDGQLLLSLVYEFLNWSSLDFTAKVYEPEAEFKSQSFSRGNLQKQLGLEVGSDTPLLLAILKRFQSGGSNYPTSPSAAPALSSPRLSPLAPLGRPLEPLGVVSRLDPPGGGALGSPPPPLGSMPSPVGLSSNNTSPAAASGGLAPLPLPSRRVPLQAPLPSAAPPAPQATLGPGPASTSAPVTPAAAAAPPAEKDDDEYSYEDDIESDDGLAGADIEDDEEEFSAAVLVGNKNSAGVSSSSSFSATQANTSHPPVPHSALGPLRGGPQNPSNTAPPAEVHPNDLSDSSMSSTGGMGVVVGRLRPGKLSTSRLSDSGNGGFGAEKPSAGRNYAGGAREKALDQDIMMTSDRSFGASHELNGGGYTQSFSQSAAPTPTGPGPAGDSGGLSFSGELPRSSDSIDKSDDIKEELRRNGLLTLSSTTSYNSIDAGAGGTPASQQHSSPLGRGGRSSSGGGAGSGGGGVYDAELSVSESMELGAGGHQPAGAGSNRNFDESDDVVSSLELSRSQKGGISGRSRVLDRNGVSMDLRETGLSASDHSGDDFDFDGADIAETAEWE